MNAKINYFLPEDTVEDAAKRQLQNIAELDFIFHHVAVMPDCHLGKGATVGSVIATKDAIIPAAVGVDIGCGMIAVLTKYTAEELPDDLAKIRTGIERRIPLGAGAYNRDLSPSVRQRYTELSSSRHTAVQDYTRLSPKWAEQIGTLGSGNHFIELSLDELGRVWIVLHSGSRGIGNQIAQKHIKIAQRLMENMQITLKDRDLAYLPSREPAFQEYIRDLLWAQDFARMNRDEMMDRVLEELSHVFYGEGGHEAEIERARINCHHNFTQQEEHFGERVWITRKGAIQMQQGQLGVIPGSMGTRSYIVTGKANPMSFCSAPHGAGRRFSRTEAGRRFTMEDFDKQMAGVECRRSEKLIDELPGAYKDVDEVMEQSKDLVDIVHVLKQVVNVKGD